MYVERLRLTDFRNYRDLDLALPKGLIVFLGRNAQGKSNLLEAVMLAATSRSFRTSSEREVVRWGTINHFARIEAEVARSSDTLDVEVIIADTGLPTEGAPKMAASAGAPAPAGCPVSQADQDQRGATSRDGPDRQGHGGRLRADGP